MAYFKNMFSMIVLISLYFLITPTSGNIEQEITGNLKNSFIMPIMIFFILYT